MGIQWCWINENSGYLMFSPIKKGVRGKCRSHWDHIAGDRVAGVTQQVPGLLGLHSMCWARWNRAAWAWVAGSSHRVCRGCTACASIAGVTRRMPGSRNECQGFWGHTACARVAGVVLCVLEMEFSMWNFYRNTPKSWTEELNFISWHWWQQSG